MLLCNSSLVGRNEDQTGADKIVNWPGDQQSCFRERFVVTDFRLVIKAVSGAFPGGLALWDFCERGFR